MVDVDLVVDVEADVQTAVGGVDGRVRLEEAKIGGVNDDGCWVVILLLGGKGDDINKATLDSIN